MRKEIGSSFDLNFEYSIFKKPSLNFSEDDMVLFNSGRDALIVILKKGIMNFGWKQVYLPSYYCKDVSQAIIDNHLEISILTYDAKPLINPDYDSVPDAHDNVIVQIGYFGNEIKSNFEFNHTKTIQDCTHNIADLKKTKCNISFASLRKQLPIPSGGVIYNRNCFSKEVFAELTPEDDHNLKLINHSNKIYKAMKLKAAYLNGKDSDKSSYLSAFMYAEEELGNISNGCRISSLSELVLATIDLKTIEEQRAKNLKYLLPLVHSNLFEVIDAPSGLCLLCINSIVKDRLKSTLIDNKIYPATLWPDQEELSDVLFSSRFLFIHTDFRYDRSDMERIAKELNEFTVCSE